jgi:transposase
MLKKASSDIEFETNREIVEQYIAGVSRDETCSKLHVGAHRVSWIRHQYDMGHCIPAPKAKGRPLKVTDRIRDFIDVKTLQSAGMSCKDLASEIRGRFSVSLCKSTIADIRNEEGFHPQPPRHDQVLNLAHVNARIQFCNHWLQPNMIQLLPLIHFSDESRFVLGDDKKWIWYRNGEENESAMQHSIKFPKGLMIFAVIGLGFKSDLLIVEGTIDSQKYIENLQKLRFIEQLDEKYGKGNWIFQQDGAPCHTSRASREWIQERCVLLQPWPANSPDLSPIELLWAILKRTIWHMSPKTISDLERVLRDSWSSISQSTIDKLCIRFKDRLQLCQQVKGDSISNLLWDCCGIKEASRQWVDILHSEPWTMQEDSLLYSLVRRFGTHWKNFLVSFPNRTSWQLKNRWYTVIRTNEAALIHDTDIMLDIRERMRRNELIPEISPGIESPNRIASAN